jgi:hypothetical protein
MYLSRLQAEERDTHNLSVPRGTPLPRGFVHFVSFHHPDTPRNESIAIAWPKFDSNHPPTYDPISGQPMSPIANDHPIVVKIADLDQKIAKT